MIDLSMFMSGPMTSLIFADGGADVIKVESVQRIDGWRAGGATEDFWWEWAPQFNWVNRNKHGITLNLTDQRGSDVIRQMVKDADILVENYTPRVMGNFGLSYEELRELNPELIMISMPGFGLTGTWSHYTAFANTTEQMSGLPHLTGYADDQPIFSGTTGGDPLAGVMGALALLSALERRRRMNEQGEPGGCHIDLSQTETATSFTGEAVTAYSISGKDPGCMGQPSPPVRSPQHVPLPQRGLDRDRLRNRCAVRRPGTSDGSVGVDSQLRIIRGSRRCAFRDRFGDRRVDARPGCPFIDARATGSGDFRRGGVRRSRPAGRSAPASAGLLHQAASHLCWRAAISAAAVPVRQLERAGGGSTIADAGSGYAGSAGSSDDVD